MKISELQKEPNFKLLQDDHQDPEISTGYTSDLLSDVMANAREGSLLITIQAHKNTVAVAGLINASGILICNDRQAPEDMLMAAKENKLAIFQTKLDQYNASVKLNSLLS